MSQPAWTQTVRRFVNSPWLSSAAAFLLCVALTRPAEGQEIPRPSSARQKSRQNLPTISNFKVGQILLRLDANLATEFLDNVNLTSEPSPDIIVTPELGINATWAITRQNTLRFRTSIGYMKYLNNPELDRPRLLISPDSALSFDILAGDFKINFHDQFSLQQEPIGQIGISGVAQIGRLTNTIGASILWDMNDVTWTLGYDHFTLNIIGGAVSTDGTVPSNVGNLDHSTDQVSTSATFQLNSVATAGLETTFAASTYPDQPSADFTSLSLGPFFEYQLTQYTHVFLGGGFKGYSNSGGASQANAAVLGSAQNQSLSGYYANVSILHTLNLYYRDQLEFGRSDDVDAFNGRAVSNFFRYSGQWRVNRKLTLTLGFSYEDIEQNTGGVLFNTGPQNFTRTSYTASTSYQLTEHATISLNCRHTENTSNLDQFSFTQNSLIISLGYRF